MDTWTPLWSGISDSSICDEDDNVFKVFIIMLAVKDADYVVRLTAYQLGRRCRKSEAEVLDALNVLASPDTKRLEKQPHDGRRIKAVEDGWLILNAEKYRAKVSDEMRKARNRRSQAAYRERKKSKAQREGEERERRYVKAHEDGELEKAEAIAVEGIVGGVL